MLGPWDGRCPGCYAHHEPHCAPDVGLPMPGSLAAIQKGCRCPIRDNHHGAGRPAGAPGSGKREFFVDDRCLLHGGYRG